MLVLIVLTALSGAHAAAPVQAPAPTCEARMEKYKTYLNSQNGPVMPAAVALGATAEMERLPAPDAAELKRLTDALEADFAGEIGSWFKAVHTNCAQTRLALGKAVMTSAAKYPALKTKIKDRVTNVMKSLRYPALLDAMIDLVLIDHGVTAGFWTGPAGIKERIKERRLEAKKASVQWNQTYDPAFENLCDETDMGKFTKALRASPHFEKIKTGFAEERALSRDLFARNRELLEQLK